MHLRGRGSAPIQSASAKELNGRRRQRRPLKTRQQLLACAAAIEARAVGRVSSILQSDIIGINVLSFFDGIGCMAQGLQRAGIPVARYEGVDNDADGMGCDKIAAHLNPRTNTFAGISRMLPQDINEITEQHIIDSGPWHLVTGGPPCKDLSKARMLPDMYGNPGKPGPGFKGPTGYLFPVFVRVVKWVLKHNPDAKFLVENVQFDHIPEDWVWAQEQLPGHRLKACLRGESCPAAAMRCCSSSLSMLLAVFHHDFERFCR